MKLAFFPGCSAKSSGMEYAKSSLELMKKLGLEIACPEFNCCGTHIVEEYNKNIWLALNARNLSLAEEIGADIVTTCPACYQNLKKTNLELGDEKVLEDVNSVLASVNREYRGSVSVFHVIEVLSKLSRKIAVESRLKVAAYYGCQILRPPELGIDDNIENPTVFENFLKNAGFEVVDFKAKTECCGGPLLLTDSDAFKKRALTIVLEAKKAGADCITTLCPLCQFSLEVVQDKMPVRPFTSLILENLASQISE